MDRIEVIDISDEVIGGLKYELNSPEWIKYVDDRIREVFKREREALKNEKLKKAG